MQWLKRILKLRRQNDSVKLMVLLAVALVVLLVSEIRDVYEIYTYTDTPAEYEMTGNLTDETALQELMDMEKVDMISLQAEEGVTLKYKSKEITVNCIYLSEQYLESVYNVGGQGAQSVLYANKAAFDAILRDFEIYSYNHNTEEMKETGFVVQNLSEDKTPASKIVLYTGNTLVPEDEPLVFSIRHKSKLEKTAGKLRVYVAKQDMEQLLLKQIAAKGYSVVNREDILEFENRINLLLQSIKYKAIIILLCGLWEFYIIKQIKLTLHR